MKGIYLGGKIFLLGVWGLGLYNELFFRSTPWSAQTGFLITLLFYTVFFIHFLEALWFYKKNQHHPDDLFNDVMLVLLFGAFHYWPASQRLARRA